jgi:hypothetical protein
MPDAHHERDVPARGTAKSYVAMGHLIKLTSVSALLGADLTDDEGRLIATVSLVSQLIKDLSRLS